LQGIQKALEPTQRTRIDRLLWIATIHASKDRLTGYFGSDASTAYRLILEEIDPYNPEATAGLKRIADIFLKRARASWKRGDSTEALSMVKAGLALVPDDRDLLALRCQISADEC
jgi:hypothetical protein